MIKFIILASNFLMISTFANVDCTNQFFKHGSGEKEIILTPECISTYIESALAGNIVDIAGNKLVGINNAIMLVDSESNILKLIAGEYTTLNNIKSISYNNSTLEIAVIENETSDIKIFSLKYPGNIAPLRVLRTNDLVGATNVALTSKKICVYNDVQKTSYEYSIEANANRRPAYQKQDLLAKNDNVTKFTCVD